MKKREQEILDRKQLVIDRKIDSLYKSIRDMQQRMCKRYQKYSCLSCPYQTESLNGCYIRDCAVAMSKLYQNKNRPILPDGSSKE
jgi:hypothetical protein